VAELTKEEQEILERLLEDDERREKIPPSQRQPITNPEKYSFPIGLDDEGKPFEDSPQQESQ
jgi:hypothetical protein